MNTNAFYMRPENLALITGDLEVETGGSIFDFAPRVKCVERPI
jgi:hypothetical protein